MGIAETFTKVSAILILLYKQYVSILSWRNLKTACFIKKHMTKTYNLSQNLLKTLEIKLNMIC